MAGRRKGKERRRGERREKESEAPTPVAVEAQGWTILAHPLFLDQIERLVVAAERATSKSDPNVKLLAHLLDLAFVRIPRDPGAAEFRHGGTLGGDRRNWFRGKTGNGRYRLFYRYQSAARIIVFAWVNDETTLRTYGSSTDAYSVFATMLDAGNPPDDWSALVKAGASAVAINRFRTLAQKRRK